MRKYKCPKCGNTYVGKKDICPSCGTPMHYRDEAKPVEEYKPLPTFHFDAPDVKSDGIEEEDESTLPQKKEELSAIEKIKQMMPADVIIPENGESYFDGRLIQKIGWTLLGALITLCTAFIAYPWATCFIYRWETKHTVIRGRRLQFDGTGGQLFGRYILWLFLSVITLGIFSIWLTIYVKKWKSKHTTFAPYNEYDLTKEKVKK